MKKLYFILVFLVIASNCKSQELTNLNDIENHVSEFLFKNGDLNELSYEKFKKTKVGISVYGLHNKIDAINLKEGVYGFSKATSHSRNYFLIYKDKSVKILDVSTQEALSNSIKEFLNFAEGNGYCVDIINDYISRFVNSYFIINKQPNIRQDKNCSKGIFSTEDLP